MTLPPGTRLGPYEVTAQIGVGGMGEVYRAHDAKLHRDVAIKVLLPAVANDFLINTVVDDAAATPIKLIQHWRPGK